MIQRSLEGKISLVTGAGSGIGRMTAFALARVGATVVVSDVDHEGGNATVEQVRKTGKEALFIPADVSEPEQVQGLIRQAVERYGRIDCAVNNAGIEGTMADTVNCSEENWHRTLKVNLTGVWLCMKEEIRCMLAQGKGAIVNIASVAGLVGFEGLPAYVASKHGVIGLTKSAALEYAKQGLRINAVCPGVIRTPMVDRLIAGAGIEDVLIAKEPVGRLGAPEEVAEAVVWLCSDSASFVTGLAMAVDGGYVAG